MKQSAALNATAKYGMSQNVEYSETRIEISKNCKIKQLFLTFRTFRSSRVGDSSELSLLRNFKIVLNTIQVNKIIYK